MDLSRALLLGIVALLLWLSLSFVLPFLEYFLLAILLAYLLLPVQERVERRVGRRVAAGVIVAATTVAVVLPLIYVVRATAAEAVALLEMVRGGAITLDRVETELLALTGVDVDLGTVLQSVVGDVQFDSVLGVFGAVTHILVGIGLTVFLLYYFLKDRVAFMRWLRHTAPLADDVQEHLFAELDHIMQAVLVGHVFIALIQGVLAGLGLVVTGIPNAMFWTVVMVVLSLLPVVGSFMVWGPAVIFLALTGQTAAAIGLFLWGAVVVGVSDDYLRPIVVDRYAQVNPSVIIVGVVGGLYVIGFMGIFFGPVVIGALRATLDVFREEFGTAV